MQRRLISAASDGFIPSRLVTARHARGLRQNELAEAINRTPATLSKWESDSYPHSPDHEGLEKLSGVLNVGVSWFFKPFETNGSAPFYRSMKSALSLARSKMAAQLRLVDEIHTTLSEWVEFPDVDIPDLMLGRDYKDLRFEDIDAIAVRLRDYWDLGDDPIDDLMLLIENAGVAVAEDFVDSAKLDGISQWIANRPVMLLAKDKEGGVRRRFDAAHELGHLLLHRHVSENEIATNIALIEEQAMAFAGAFLLPTAAFVSSTYEISLDGFADVKPRWKVSVAAMIKRARALDLVSEEHERNLWKYYSYKRWRGNEPYDDRLEVERPINLGQAVDMLAEESAESVSEFLRSVSLPRQDIERLTGVTLPGPMIERSKIKLRVVGGKGEARAAAND